MMSMKNKNVKKAFMVVLIVSMALVSCKKQTKIDLGMTPPKQEETKKTDETKLTPSIEITPSFEIIKKTDKDRKDGGMTYYVITRPVNLSSHAFVGQIKNIVRKIANSEPKQETITIAIFDSLNALDWVVNKRDLASPLLKTRYVAKFVGNAEGETYKNTLYIYPFATQETPTIKNYIDIIEFDPID